MPTSSFLESVVSYVVEKALRGSSGLGPWRWGDYLDYVGEGQCNHSVKRLGKKDVMERTENPLTPHQKNTTSHCWPQRWGREPPTREKVAPGNWEGGEMVLPQESPCAPEGSSPGMLGPAQETHFGPVTSRPVTQ